MFVYPRRAGLFFMSVQYEKDLKKREEKIPSHLFIFLPATGNTQDVFYNSYYFTRNKRS